MDILPPLHLLHVLEFSKKDAQKAAELEIELENKERKVTDYSFDNIFNCYQ